MTAHWALAPSFQPNCVVWKVLFYMFNSFPVNRCSLIKFIGSHYSFENQPFPYFLFIWSTKTESIYSTSQFSLQLKFLPEILRVNGSGISREICSEFIFWCLFWLITCQSSDPLRNKNNYLLQYQNGKYWINSNSRFRMDFSRYFEHVLFTQQLPSNICNETFLSAVNLWLTSNEHLFRSQIAKNLASVTIV